MSEVSRLPDREPPSLLNIIARALHDGTDIDKLERLLQMQERLIADDRRLAFHAAMAACQAEMEPVARGAYNPQTQSRYAALPAIDKAIRPVYTRHGFALTFGTGTPSTPGYINVTCRVSHSAGHVEEYQLEGHPDTTGTRGQVNKTELHGLGSTISYLRRYLTVLVFNIAILTDDDDGNAGGGRIRNIADGMGENARREPSRQRTPTPRPGGWAPLNADGGVALEDVPGPDNVDKSLNALQIAARDVPDAEAADKLLTGEGAMKLKQFLTDHQDARIFRFNSIVFDTLHRFADPPKDEEDAPGEPMSRGLTDQGVPKDGSESA